MNNYSLKVVFCVGCLVLFSGRALQAQTLALNPIMAPVDDPLPIVKVKALIPCDKIIDQMVTHNQLAAQHEQSLVGFLNDVNSKISSWYDALSPLEGNSQVLASGTFSPLQDGADKTAQITAMASDNSNLLIYDLNHIIASLRACTLAAP